MAWQKNGSFTNTGTADPITTPLDGPLTFNVILSHLLITVNANNGLRLGSTTIDSGLNYAVRQSRNGGVDSTLTGRAQMDNNVTGFDEFVVAYVINISSEEKLCIAVGVGQGEVGAADAPDRNESYGKWANTSNQFDIIEEFDYGGAGTFNIDSNLSALGTD